MKRLLIVFLLATSPFLACLAQNLETPICYAFTEAKGYESTLKYKFSYQDEKYFINLRLVGHDNSLNAGDQVIFETKNGTRYTYVIPKKEEESEYQPFEIGYTDILQYQEGLNSITLVKEGKSKTLVLTSYCNSCTQRGAKGIIGDAYSLEKKKGRTAIEEEKLKVVQAKAKVFEEEKTTGAYLINVPFYNRLFAGYTPTQFKDGGDYAEGFTFGYTGGLCLNKKSTVYLEFGVQGDFFHQKVIESKNVFAFSIPIAITNRIELGHSGVTLSPFIGPMVRFNITESGSDIFQIGGQGGLNLDYRHLNFGVAYHFEVWTKGSNHSRGLALRLGYTF